MPPDSVPVLLLTRLLPIWMLCAQPCTKMPPPPCELSVMPRPSMLDGLHQKLLGNGLRLTPFPQLPLLFVRRVVTGGNPPGSAPSLHGSAPWKFTPLASTVIPAPEYAPISVGSCNSSARLPLRLAVQPTVASKGNRSTCGALGVALKSLQPAIGQAKVPVGS